MPSPIRSRYAERRIDQICITCWLVLFNYYYGPRTDTIPFMPLVRLAPCKDWPVFTIAHVIGAIFWRFRSASRKPGGSARRPQRLTGLAKTFLKITSTYAPPQLCQSWSSQHRQRPCTRVPVEERSAASAPDIRGQLSLQAPVPSARQPLQFSWLALHARSEGLCKGLADAVEASHSGASRLPSGALRTRDTSTTTWEGSTW